MKSGPRMPTLKPDQNLSPRERQVVSLVIDGHTNKSIAGILGISMDTAKTHIENAFNKSGCESRLQLALKYSTPIPKEDLRRDLLLQRAEVAGRLAIIDKKLAILEGKSDEENIRIAIDFDAVAGSSGVHAGSHRNSPADYH